MFSGSARAPHPAVCRSNVELKARLHDLEAARRVARGLATRRLDDEHQVDTYFHCSQGRLKLREINGTRSVLIAYSRPDQHSAKVSEYYLIDVADAEGLKNALRCALGIRQIVRKDREIYLYENVRIHLDRVQDLGCFLEFEAVLDTHHTVRQGHDQLEHLQGVFSLTPSDLLTGSYGEM